MLDILSYIGTNPEERKKLDEEAYWERFNYHNSGKLAEALEALEGQKYVMCAANPVPYYIEIGQEPL
ncbi:MAG: hypothetical protein LBC70_02710 [Chitinispirillales bacterium]|jgi:spore maturation protein CgeB|nr:hypothetical protein [Chitinispirillales bacterium]